MTLESDDYHTSKTVSRRASNFVAAPVVPFRPMSELEPPETRQAITAVLQWLSPLLYSCGVWIPRVKRWLVHTEEESVLRGDEWFDAFCALPTEREQP